MLAQDSVVFKEALGQLDLLLDQLTPLCSSSENRGSVLLRELAANDQPGQAMHQQSQTPLLHAMSATHAYINMFVHICRGSQVTITSVSFCCCSKALHLKNRFHKDFLSFFYCYSAEMNKCKLSKDSANFAKKLFANFKFTTVLRSLLCLSTPPNFDKLW